MDLSPEQLEALVTALVSELGPTFVRITVGGVVLAVVLNALLKFPVAWGFKKLNGKVGGLSPDELAAAIVANMDIPGYPACFYDPKHFERVKNVETRVKNVETKIETWDDKIHAGDFGCSWTRDEVVRHKDSQ